MRIGLLAGCMIAAALGPAAASAQRQAYAPSAAASAKPLPQPQRIERLFLQLASGSLRLQADASRLAAGRSGNQAVKDVAAMVLARHAQAQPELQRLLQVRGMAPPMPSNAHAKALRQLAKANGARFDRAYTDDVLLHALQDDIALYEKAAPQVEDPVLKAWIARQLPALRAQAEKADRALPGAALRGQRAV